MQNMNKKNLLIALLLVPVAASAGVMLQNGNFYITYQDITLEAGPHKLALARTYNSFASQIGWFGAGWGSQFETRLIAMPDGTAAIHENGNGGINYYRPAGKVDVAAGVEQILQAAVQREHLAPEAAASLRGKLAADEELRMRKVKDYGMQAELAAGSELSSDQCVGARLLRVADGYKRRNCYGGDDYFDLQGRMTRHEEDDGYQIRASYAGARPETISDSAGNTIKLAWTASGRLQDASTNGKHHLIYSYSGKNELVKSNDVNGNQYVYDYDSNQNLTRITYIDQSTMRIEYVSPESGRVSSVTDRHGEQVRYEYRSDPADPQHTWTKVTTLSAAGKQLVSNYEFQNERTVTGEERTRPVAISNSNDLRAIAYDDQGRVVRKTNASGGVIEFVYHPRSGKLILVVSKGLTTAFYYDGDGKLTSARNTAGQRIDLDYANTSSIQRIVETDSREKLRRELTFKYNDNEKPVEITMAGKGKIVVEYDDKGEILHVRSDQGQEMAMQVVAVFQNLMEVVRVAGARFSM